jgi:hypothetical protein
LRDRLVQRMESLSEPQAARRVRELALLDQDAPAALVPLVADERAAVADAAAATIDRLVADWNGLPAAEVAPRIAALAHELAAAAPQLPVERRAWAHALATRLLVWPLGATIDSGQIVADCETVLRLPIEEAGEIRLAAAERTIEAEPVEIASPPPLAPELPATLPAAPSTEPDPVIPRVYGPVEPGRLIDASKERPIQPKQFLPPRAMKIEDS